MDRYEILPDEDQLENLDAICYPVKSFSFLNKDKVFYSEINFCKVYVEQGYLTAGGNDKWGEFYIFGKFSPNKTNVIYLKKIYEDHILDVSLELQGSKLVGLWKTPQQIYFEPNNTVEVSFNLQKYDLYVTDTSGRIKKTNIFSNFLIDNNLSNYVSLSYNGHVPIFHDCSVYDITHVAYSKNLFSREKHYLTGSFILDSMSFDLKCTELIK